ncbi:MerR family transcriptional regulator [Agrobacterium sp. NPDC089420]|uniref:MerR family transcriptional regulator n=1 Tax=Agrobacterium sp. NPDC089420 TaxID=3363918 RepID=UPI00384CB531
MPVTENRFNVTQLAHLAGVSERTVRYYVREELIDPPSGRGRGSHFDHGHLAQLRCVRMLQDGGMSNADIRTHRQSIESLLAERGIPIEEAERNWANFSAQSAEFHKIIAGAQIAPVAELVTRIRVADGISLIVDHPVRLPSPEKLSAAVNAVRTAFALSDHQNEGREHAQQRGTGAVKT